MPSIERDIGTTADRTVLPEPGILLAHVPAEMPRIRQGENWGRVDAWSTVRRTETGRFIDIMFDTVGTSLTLARNSELYAEDQPVEQFYRVESGAVRTCKILNDGRRQIDGFYLPGDIVGIEAGSRHLYAAEALVRTTLRAVKVRNVRSQAADGGEMALELWDMIARELRRSQDHIQLLSRRSAQERLASFLLAMSERDTGKYMSERDTGKYMSERDTGKPMASIQQTIDLPMSRQDMADYLGLTIETVSRTFTQLEAQGVLELVTARRIKVNNRMALCDMHG